MKPRKFVKNVSVLLMLVIVFASCSWFDRSETDSGWINWDSTGGWTASEEEGWFGSEAGSVRLLELSDGAPASAPDAEPTRSETSAASQAPNLRAGSVDDNASWDDYLCYRLQFSGWGIPVHDHDVTERHVIRLETPAGLPVLGAVVRILSAQGEPIADLRTTSEGRVLFFPAIYHLAPGENFQIEAHKDGASVSQRVDRNIREHTIVLDTSSSTSPVRVDVHFLIDATGSMADEIQQLKENMIAIAENIQALGSQPDVRFGMTVYRDRGDLFVSRTFDFTPDVVLFVEELAALAAEGGGDYPESLNEGLHDALHLPEWRGEDTISLVFLIADAPPHLDYANDFDYASEILFAAGRGIKIFPLASSGLDDQGEYIFRQIAQITGGKFLFLTYGAGGAPGDETSHHVDDYSALSLNQLILRLIEEELANLTPE